MGTKETTNRRKLTPEQMENLVRVSCEISGINEIFGLSLNRRPRQIVRFCKGLDTIAVVSKSRDNCNYEGDICQDRIIVADDFFEMLKNYFTEKKNLLVEEIEAIMSEEGGEK